MHGAGALHIQSVCGRARCVCVCVCVGGINDKIRCWMKNASLVMCIVNSEAACDGLIAQTCVSEGLAVYVAR